jgi:hypothetical protein
LDLLRRSKRRFSVLTIRWARRRAFFSPIPPSILISLPPPQKHNKKKAAF